MGICLSCNTMLHVFGFQVVISKAKIRIYSDSICKFNWLPWHWPFKKNPLLSPCRWDVLTFEHIKEATSFKRQPSLLSLFRYRHSQQLHACLPVLFWIIQNIFHRPLINQRTTQPIFLVKLVIFSKKKNVVTSKSSSHLADPHFLKQNLSIQVSMMSLYINVISRHFHKKHFNERQLVGEKL